MTMNLRQKLRASHVKRWHLVETIKPQTVAEHSFNVCLISEEICTVLQFPQELCDRVVEYAIHHDIPEVLYGDIPTPTKAYLNCDNLDYLSQLADPKSQTTVHLVSSVVKLADTVEAVMFLHMYGVGRHAQHVAAQLKSRVNDMVRLFVIPEQVRGDLYVLIDVMCEWETSTDDGREI